MDKPKPSKQQTPKPGKPKSSSPVKAKPVKTTQTTGQRSTTQPAAAKPSKPSAAAAMQQKQQQQKQGTKPAARKQQDWPQVEPMEVDDMQPSTSGRLPPTAASPAVAGGTAISTGRGFGRLAPVAESGAEGAPQRLRLFAYAVESKRVMAALQECGLDHRFVFTPDLKQAQAIVSCKMTPGGKTQNLAQVGSWWAVSGCGVEQVHQRRIPPLNVHIPGQARHSRAVCFAVDPIQDLRPVG
jgi:hypothetical protein